MHWNDVQKFISQINKTEGIDKYRLPTEAEWEYAARAGTTSKYSFGNSTNDLEDYAWYNKNSGYQIQPVGRKSPNTWGLFDMQGNVWEWVQDWYGNYPSGSVTDHAGTSLGSFRVNRGGSWSSKAFSCRSANRGYDYPDKRSNYVGFRLVRKP